MSANYQKQSSPIRSPDSGGCFYDPRPSDFIAQRSGDAKLDRAIEKANSEFIAAMKTGNAAVIAAPYSESAVFIAIDGTCTQGRKEIEKLYRAPDSSARASRARQKS